MTEKGPERFRKEDGMNGEVDDAFDGDRMSHGWAEMWDPEALSEALRQKRKRQEAIVDDAGLDP
jgi:hypothetical protein